MALVGVLELACMAHECHKPMIGAMATAISKVRCE